MPEGCLCLWFPGTESERAIVMLVDPQTLKTLMMIHLEQRGVYRMVVTTICKSRADWSIKCGSATICPYTTDWSIKCACYHYMSPRADCSIKCGC